MVGNLIAMVYVGFGFSYILKIKKIYKYIFCLLFIFLTLYGLSKHSNPRELRSIVGFEKLKKSYDETKMLLRAYEPTFVEPNVGLRLFNAERDTFKTVSSIAGANNFDNRNAVLRRPVVPKVAVDTVAKKGISYNKVIQSDSVVTSEKTAYIVDSRKNKESKDDVSNKAEQALERDILERDSGGRYTNILFRLFIWNEAFTELKADYPIFGFAFGKPFRCRTLEILNWGRDEWLNDGWVCLHNSYLDIIYRAGIVGIFIIVCLLVILFSLIRRSFKIRSLTGVLLTGILVNWFVAANFLEILEMPYSAIPIWSLFGLTYSYLFKNKNL